MTDIVGVRFKRAGRVYYFDPAGIALESNESVVVETTRGIEVGQVVIAPKQVAASEITIPLKPVVRKASPEDIQQSQELGEKEKHALAECNKLINHLNLPMKLLKAEYNLDGSRVTIYFGSEDRVDFRELVRQLTGILRTRVDLRQVGPRDEAKLIGGLGRCGRHLCCSSFLSGFEPISIKMAKDQDLPLNPMKISGVCGRLLCCLTYENSQYREAKTRLPRAGQPVTTPNGPGIVSSINALKETVWVENPETRASLEFPLAQVQFVPRVKQEQRPSTKGGPRGAVKTEPRPAPAANAVRPDAPAPRPEAAAPQPPKPETVTEPPPSGPAEQKTEPPAPPPQP